MTTELPPGWRVETGRSRRTETFPEGRDFWVITAPDDTRWTWYQQQGGHPGDVRLHRPHHTIEEGSRRRHDDGHSLYLNFRPMENG